MFQKFIIFFIIILASIFQMSVFPNLFPEGLAPEIMLMLVIFWTTQENFEKMWARIVLSGFILDLYMFWPIGTNIIALLIISFATGFLTKRFHVSQKNMGFLLMLILVAGGTIANNLLLNIISIASDKIWGMEIGSYMLGIFDKRIVPKVILNLFLFILIYWPLVNLDKFLSFYNRKGMQGRFFK